VKVRSLGYR